MTASMNRKVIDPKIEQIVQILVDLPPAKVVDVRDYVLFLGNRYGYSGAVDESDAWTEDDMRDISMASMNYALQSVWEDAEND